jgi:hypothetical protein
VDRFRGTPAAGVEEYQLLERLLREQCHVGRHWDGRPEADDDDAGAGKVPIALKDTQEVRANSLQSPHDPDVTYSGHKGKGYEVQVAEPCHAENALQIITHVEVTPSSGSDTAVTGPVVEALEQRRMRPDELLADTAYGSGRNAFEAERRGTEVVRPMAGPAPRPRDTTEQEVAPPGTSPWRSTTGGRSPKWSSSIDCIGSSSMMNPNGEDVVVARIIHTDNPRQLSWHWLRVGAAGMLTP